MPVPRKLPVVLSREEVARLLEATSSLKHQAAFAVAYGAGRRQADLLPVEHYHLVFSLPTPVSDLAYSNKPVIYTIPKALASLMGQAFLFKAAAETLQTIAADPKHLGTRVKPMHHRG